MDNATHLDIVLSRIKRLDCNPERIKKHYKKVLEIYKYKCRLKLTKSDVFFEKQIKKICDLIQTSITQENLKTGSVLVVLSIVDIFLLGLDEIKERISNLHDKDLLKIAHEKIISKGNEIINVLTDNLSNPVTLDELLKIVNEEENKEESDKK